MRSPLVCLLVTLSLFSSPILKTTAAPLYHQAQLKKKLPLDGVPNVTLKTRENSRYLNGRFIVKLMPDVDASALAAPLKSISGYSMTPMFPPEMAQRRKGDVDLSRFFVVTYSSPIDAFSAAEEISRLPAVQYAEPWFVYPVSEQPAFNPTDSLFASQWGLSKIQAAAAWDVTQGDTTVVIGIVDSGVQLDHPDLAANIWHNPGETGLDVFSRDKRSNGIDDDNNGFIDDWQGWDFGGADYNILVPDNNPNPTGSNNEHGTHVAGIASAVTNNGRGVAGTGFRCRLLAVKTGADNDTRGPGGLGYILAGYEGIAYAAFMGATVMNCSWGGAGGTQTEQDIIDYATQQGTLIVAAAGNGNSNTPHFPSAYNNVLSVAATTSLDQRATFSNYGPTVDVSAPGVSILSTLYPSTYDYWDGTSMAAPFAAGLAGLVKAVKPGFSAVQIGEQIRVTSDNIDSQNPSFVRALGKGRINCSRAVAENPPSVRVQDLTISDSLGGNNNGIPEPNETVDVYMTFINYLAPTTNVVCILSTTSPHLSIVNAGFALGSLHPLATARNTASPFQVHVSALAPPGQPAGLTLSIDDGAYTDYQEFTIVLNPTFRTHDVTNLSVTMTNNGRIGFNDYPDNKQGVGFIYPAGGNNQIFEGGIIIGTSADKVVDNVRITTQQSQDNDFLAQGVFQMQTPGLVSNQDGYTSFSDSAVPAASRLGIRVDERSYAYADSLNDDYVIVSYDVRNLGETALADIYFGIFADWDIGDPQANRSTFDAPRSLTYAWEENSTSSPWMGICALDGAASVRALTNGSSLNLGRGDKWECISGGTAQSTAGPGDMLSVISSGPFTLGPGAAKQIGFAFVGGANLTTLQTNTDAAHSRWNIITGFNSDEPKGKIPSAFNLVQNYPNPFNPTTTIDFEIQYPGLVTLKVFDVLGRETAVLVNEFLQPGRRSVEFKGGSLSSGIYYYQLRSGSSMTTRKMVLQK